MDELRGVSEAGGLPGSQVSQPVSPDEAGQQRHVSAEAYRIRAVQEELAWLRPWGAVTPAALDQLRRYYDERWAALNPTPPVHSRDQGSALAPSARRGPSWQEFLAERSILIVSYLGAFLLIVATLLFEVYGAGGLSGLVRFGGVLALNVVFGTAGWACYGSARLRLVGATYTAIFALTAPLVFVAAYVFLVLKQYGISADLALAMTGVSCAVLYGALAGRLQSRGYAALALAALAAGWIGAVDALELGPWRPAALTPLVAVGGALVARPRWLRGGGVFAAPAAYLVHGAAVVAVLWTVVEDGGPADPAWYRAATFAGVTAGYAATCWLARRPGLLWTVAVGLTATALAASASLKLGQAGAAVILVGLAWAYAVVSRRLPGAGAGGASSRPPVFRPGPRHVLRALAGLQALACAALIARPDWLQASVLLAASALGVFLAMDRGRPAWLLLAFTLFSVAWYWLAKAVLPPPPQPAATTLLLVYSPLPVLQAAVALVLHAVQGPESPLQRWQRHGFRPSSGRERLGGEHLGARRGAVAREDGVPSDAAGATERTPGKGWGWPVYLVALVNAGWIVAGALVQGEFTLLGWVLLAYAAAGYAAAAVERFTLGVAGASLGLAGGVVSLLYAGAVASAWYPPAVSALAWAVYGAGYAWERYAHDRLQTPGAGSVGAETNARAWVRVHRLAALTGAGVAAWSCLGVASFGRLGDTGALAALAAWWSFAGMLYLDGRRGRAEMEYVAGLVAALGGGWLARYAGLANPQWYVALPGACLVAEGLALRRQRRLARATRLGRWMVGTGGALLLGTTAYQTVGPLASIYTAVLVLESAAAVLAGIGLRHRTLVLLGAGGVAVGALRALFLILQQVPLFAVFGVVALTLLAGAAVLAALRERLAAARTGIAGWSDWE